LCVAVFGSGITVGEQLVSNSAHTGAPPAAHYAERVNPRREATSDVTPRSSRCPRAGYMIG